MDFALSKKFEFFMEKVASFITKNHISVLPFVSFPLIFILLALFLILVVFLAVRVARRVCVIVCGDAGVVEGFGFLLVLLRSGANTSQPTHFPFKHCQIVVTKS